MADAFSVGVACSVGVGPERGGRSYNEDNFLVLRDGVARMRQEDQDHREPALGSGLLVAVADGMGGHARGEVASAAAVRSLLHLSRATQLPDPEETLRAFVLQAHARLNAQARAQGAGNMGTTLTAVWVQEGVASWVHVGDSRLYLCRGDGLARITRDHTRGEFSRRDGRPLPKDPNALVQGFVFGSRGMGDDRALRIDPGRDTGRIPLAVGDLLLLCSDGLHGFVPEERLYHALRDAPDPESCAHWLVKAAMDGGSDDNITALVVRVDALSERAWAPEAGEPLEEVRTLVPDDPTE